MKNFDGKAWLMPGKRVLLRRGINLGEKAIIPLNEFNKNPYYSHTDLIKYQKRDGILVYEDNSLRFANTRYIGEMIYEDFRGFLFSREGKTYLLEKEGNEFIISEEYTAINVYYHVSHIFSEKVHYYGVPQYICGIPRQHKYTLYKYLYKVFGPDILRDIYNIYKYSLNTSLLGIEEEHIIPQSLKEPRIWDSKLYSKFYAEMHKIMKQNDFNKPIVEVEDSAAEAVGAELIEDSCFGEIHRHLVPKGYNGPLIISDGEFVGNNKRAETE